MSLYGTIQIANNALFASQVGLQVTGNNISNANTPGYIKQQAVFATAPTQLVGGLPLGLGVRVHGIVQQTDRFLAERMRSALSDVSDSQTQQKSFNQLEALLGELSDTDLSSAMTDFFGSINDILNQPHDLAVRNLALLQGQTLAERVKQLDSRGRELRREFDNEVALVAADINRLVAQLGELNLKIVESERGGTSNSEAVGLRDQRQNALGELAALVGIRSVEQDNGSVTVFAGGDYLVFDGEIRPVNVAITDETGLNSSTVQIADTDAPLTASSGKLAGLYAARDEVLEPFLENVDEFTKTLIFEFNRIHSGGQGLSGFQDVTSEFTVDSTDAPLDEANLPFTPENGSFRVLTHNTRTGVTETVDVIVDLNGLDNDTSLDDLAEAINAADGISAEVTPNLGLRITSDSENVEFTFGDDTSGVLAALGINTFFGGIGSGDIHVASNMRENGARIAASRGGLGVDGRNAEQLAGFANLPLDSKGGQSITGTYERMVSEVAQGSSVSQAVAEGFSVFHRALEAEHLGISGVSVDEEAVSMIAFQKAYQASARLIGVVTQLLDELVKL